MNVFLSAEWRNLINLTYEVEPDLLEEYLPKGIELDTALNGKAHVSLVAFDFLNTRVKGLSIPWHINFPEINLRFYVRYQGQVGVVFIREYVPKHCIAWVANRIYNEPYQAIPMRSVVTKADFEMTALHTFRKKGRDFSIAASGGAESIIPGHESTEHYFKEHTWGFGTAHSGKTMCYRVEHPVWRVYPFKDFKLHVDFGFLYGSKWAFLNEATPTYKVFAEGSAVKVLGPFRSMSLMQLSQSYPHDKVKGILNNLPPNSIRQEFLLSQETVFL